VEHFLQKGGSASNPATPVLAAPDLDNNDPPVPVPFPGLPTVIVLTDDGMGGAEVLLRVDPNWSCTPVIQSGSDHFVECVSSRPLDNICVIVTVVVDLASGTAECTGGSGLSATAAPALLGAGTTVAGPDPSFSTLSPFRCTAHLGSPSLPGWTVTCKVNNP